MKIVIEISEDLYEMCRDNLGSEDNIEGIIANGRPLPKGHWIEVDNGYICSECDIIRAKGTTGKYNYCPNCGARMERAVSE